MSLSNEQKMFNNRRRHLINVVKSVMVLDTEQTLLFREDMASITLASFHKKTEKYSNDINAVHRTLTHVKTELALYPMSEKLRGAFNSFSAGSLVGREAANRILSIMEDDLAHSESETPEVTAA